MQRKKYKRPHGQVRSSQLITSFGPGAMIDLPDHSVLVGGLDSWSDGGEEINEPRLAEKLRLLLDLSSPTLRLLAPPPDLDDPLGPQTGVTAWQFPEWFITQDVETGSIPGISRKRKLIHRKRLTKGKFIDDDRKRRSVVPIMFVRACKKGHLGDIDWKTFAHGDHTDCSRQLWIEERGTSGDLSEIFIRCDCGLEQSMSAAIETAHALGQCDGKRPWLGNYANERNCGEPNRMLIRTASNAYFPQLMSVISLPDKSDGLSEAVERAWDFIGEADSEQDVANERKKSKVRRYLEDHGDYEVFEEVRVRRGEVPQEKKSVKQAEMEILISSKEELGEDKPDGDFFARTLPKEKWQSDSAMKSIERVVLVHRLREVMAQVGFTRFESVSPDIDGELEIGVARAPLAREISWLPAIENRGEGIFLQFNAELVEQWIAREDVVQYGHKLLAGYEAWKEERSGAKKKFIEEGGSLLQYVLFHSFSHLLITSISLECGYPASSIRERIYVLPGLGYGVLLYTGSSDAEGTLGGLVEAGRVINKHIRNALRMGELCSNDPVCAHHEPADKNEGRFLSGAACHGCLLISETSCEHGNEFLDRSLVVQTIENKGVEFFSV